MLNDITLTADGLSPSWRLTDEFGVSLAGYDWSSVGIYPVGGGSLQYRVKYTPPIGIPQWGLEGRDNIGGPIAGTTITLPGASSASTPSNPGGVIVYGTQGMQAALFTSQFSQVGFGSSQVINPQLPVIARPTNTGLSIAWRLVGAGAALGGATAVSVCRLYGSLTLTSAFTGIQMTFLKDERDMVLSLLLPAALPVVIPGIASDYLFWASISTIQGAMLTAPILVTAVS